MLKIIFVIAAFLISLSAACHAGGLDGAYRLEKDSDGKIPKTRANVILTFKGATFGSVFLKAVQPGETVTDTGTFSVDGEFITLSFREMVWEATRQPFTLAGCTLTLPFKALAEDDQPGTSTWVRESAPCRQQGSATAALSPADGSSGVASATGALPASKRAAEAGQIPNAAPAAGKPAGVPSSAPSLPALFKKYKTPKCGCKHIKAIERNIKGDEYLQKKFEEKAIAYQNELDSCSKDKGCSPAFLNKVQINDYEQWRKKLPEEFKAAMEYDTAVTLSPDLKRQDQVNAEELESIVRASACQEIAQAAIVHENYHIKITKELEAGARKFNTVVDLAREEVDAYGAGLQALHALRDRMKKECTWACINDGKTYGNHSECERACPSGLGKPIVLGFRCKEVQAP